MKSFSLAIASFTVREAKEEIHKIVCSAPLLFVEAVLVLTLPNQWRSFCVMTNYHKGVKHEWINRLPRD